MPVIDQLHCFDNLTGYKYGQFLWLSFWVPSFLVLLIDDTQGPGRMFLTGATMLSSGTLLYYNTFRWVDEPASTPGMFGLTAEVLARWVLAAHCGVSNIVGTTPIGAWNTFQLVAMTLFGVSHLTASIYSTCNWKEYRAYSKALKDGDKVY